MSASPQDFNFSLNFRFFIHFWNFSRAIFVDYLFFSYRLFAFFRLVTISIFKLITFLLHFYSNRDEHEPLNMDSDCMRKPLSAEYDGRTVHSRSGEFIGKSSPV